MNIITGDLVKLTKQGNFDVVIQGCNIQCVQNKGLAKEMREAFPAVYEADFETYTGDKSKLGYYSKAQVNTSGKLVHIFNAYTQEFYGRMHKSFNYNYLEESIDAILYHLKVNDYDLKAIKFGLPLIGCGYGKADADKVKAILEKKFKGLNLTIVNRSRYE